MINLQEQVGSKGSIRTTKGYHCTTQDTIHDMLNSTDGNIRCRVVPCSLSQPILLAKGDHCVGDCTDGP